MEGTSVRKRKRTYTSFSFSLGGLTKKRGVDGLIFSAGENCDFSKDRLAAGLGLESVRSLTGGEILSEWADDEVASVCVYCENAELNTGECVCVLLKNGKLFFYERETATFTEVGNGYSEEACLVPAYQAGEPTVIGVLGASGVRVAYPTGETAVLYERPVSATGAFFHGRIFFVDGFSVRYGAPFLFDDFEENADDAGTIELGSEGGEIVALVSCGEKLFAVRQYGLVEISALGAAREFALKKIAYGGGEVKRGGVCAVGESLIFLATDGVYRFSNGGFSKILSGKIADLDETGKLVASAVDGKYRLDYLNTDGEKRSLVVNGEDGSYYFSFPIYGGRGGGFTAGVLDRVFVKATEGGALPTGEKHVARVGGLEFGALGEKVVRKLRCFGRGELALTIRSERGEKRAELVLEPYAAAEFALKGREFEIEFVLKSGAAVERLEVEFDLIGGEK